MTDVNNKDVRGDKRAVAKIYKPKGKTDKQIAADTESELKTLARETGTKRVATLEQERRESEKQPARLAKGLDVQNAPHSTKAAHDRNAKQKAAEPAKAKPAPEKQAARVEAKAAKAAPKADDSRKIIVLDKKFVYGGDGTARRAAWDACKAGKTVAEYAAAGGALKYLPRWVAAGAIKLA